MIVIDLQNAFDTLDHDACLKIWSVWAFESQSSNGSNPIFLIGNFCIAKRSFLGRSFNYMRSSTRFYSGTTRLLIYINDLPIALSETASDLYADNTCIYYQDKETHWKSNGPKLSQ